LTMRRFPFFKSNGRSRLPRAIYLMPTLNCNLNCVMCDVDTRSDTDKELAPADYERLLGELNTWRRRPYFYIGGGEPLIYRHFNELMRIINRNRYEVMVNTNGMLLSRFARTIMDNDIKILIISIDGREKTHNEIRRNNASFSSIVSGINEINNLKKKKGTSRPLIVVSNVVLPQNYREYYEFLKELNGLHIHAITIHPLKYITSSQYEAQKRFVEGAFGKGHYYFPRMRVWDDLDIDGEAFAK